MLSAADELVSYRDAETIQRRTVELARDRLGLERVAFFVLGDGDQLCGTFGTGPSGETTDERDIVFALGESHREAMSRSLAEVGRWLVLDDVPLVSQREGKTVIVGRGWNVLTPVRSRTGITGMLMNDAALSRAALDESKQVQLAVLATILGNLLELKRHDARALPWSPTLSGTGDGTPSLRAKSLPEEVAKAMKRVCEDPSVETRVLARAAYITPRVLAKHFRDQVGVPLIDYRNRVRVERFLGLVERGGGNLLQAALDAGFGSYAQFHRVFRRMLGVTPREYLTGRERG